MLGLLQRVLEHDLLLLKLLLLGLELSHTRSQKLNLLLALVQLVVELLRLVLLFSGLVAHAADLGLNLKDLVVALINELLDGLKRLVALLHAKQALLPVLEERLLAHHDALNLNGSLLESVASSSCLLLLGDELSLVQGLLLVETLDLLVHGVDEVILLLLGLLEVGDVLLGTICGAPRNGNFRLHDLVVFLDLLQRPVKLVQFFLGLKHALELLIGLLLLALVLALEDLVLALGLGAVALHDVVVVVSALESGLHARQLVLNAIQLDTGLLAGLADLADGFLALTQLQVDALVLVSQLLRQRVLQARHQRLY